ncbi:hypothetical protein RvY_05303-1 [Ramazzottius varieornatus]|uniref:Cadherin domain-containing protein n=1 Tax=Ramazzottius varieornatus TaxID=947166 RepID=A0A1D1UUM0_RAMVA|nr:hypothetical protein RvY_05303-1 [Ramazzottius varieornatus]
MSLVSLIPVTVHMQRVEKKLLTSSPMVADYPHIIQSYQSRKLCMGSRPHFLLNVLALLPSFVRSTVKNLQNGPTTENTLLEMREDSFWTTDKFCKLEQTQTRYHHFNIRYQVTGGEKFAEQDVDLLVHQTEENDRPRSVRSRRHRRHRKTRAVSLSFGSPSFTAFVTEEKPAPVYVTKMNITNSKPVRFSMIALTDSRSQPLFSIDAETGVIQTETQLDRETKSEHFFRVTASQLDKLATATTTLTIRVEDINDYTPTFEKNDYFVELPENVAPGSIVVTVRANDYDAGENGAVSYSMITGDNMAFEIDGRNGVITTRKPLDRETLQEIFLYVKAEDQGHVDQRKSRYLLEKACL